MSHRPELAKPGGRPVMSAQTLGRPVELLNLAGTYITKISSELNRTFYPPRRREGGRGVAEYHARRNRIFDAVVLPYGRPVYLEKDEQNFEGFATDWEKRYCLPLGKGRPFSLPAVDDRGRIVGHVGVARNSNLWIKGVGGKPQVPCGIDGWHVDEDAWRNQAFDTCYAEFNTAVASEMETRYGWRHFYHNYNGYAVLCDVDGKVLRLLKYTTAFDQIESDGLGLLDYVGFATFGAAIVKGIAKSGVMTLLRVASRRTVVGPAGDALASQIRADVGKVRINLGGTGEVPHAINLNNLSRGQKSGIPHLLEGQAEDIGSLFSHGSIDEVIANNIPPAMMNWSQVARGSFDVLKSGGNVGFAELAGGRLAGSNIKEALRAAGFKDITVFNDILVTAVKP